MGTQQKQLRKKTRLSQAKKKPAFKLPLDRTPHWMRKLPLWLQYTVIALAIVISIVVVARKQFPRQLAAARKRLAIWLLREGRAPSLQALGRRLAPATTSNAANCGGCDSCGD